MSGCCVSWKCARAWRFFDESQQPTWPHSRHMRRCTQVSPVLRQSSHPLADGFTLFMCSFPCSQVGFATVSLLLVLIQVHSRIHSHSFQRRRRASRLEMACVGCGAGCAT